ncbi:magnesium transporter [Defluviimonas sp. 20V17]|uniref:Magnesium transport protein CorA n=1 Tax=Allgaiera indica TaxID=765699 RepID=A0AAN4UN62_9RHOB|nr:magnesium/cobalt transporter CorA [Allgaiera indica]KDB02481.1 magnesium transporter [Defluviimonas sp. 20V17]GHD98739.1 hypothetical protein GCM10008024_03460 [Allgaiera indica]SDW07277.1 magnesium transporter [Allgaiera indica]
MTETAKPRQGGKGSKKGKTRRRKPARAPAGAPPGRIVAQPGAHATRLSFTAFHPGGLSHPEDLDAALAILAAPPPSAGQDAPGGGLWIDIVGLADTARIESVCARLGLHTLSVADIFSTGQRPKTEIYETYVHVVLRQPLSTTPYVDEQLTLILGDRFVLTVQERPGDSFDPVRQRLTVGGPRIRSSAGYLAYALMDALVDAYFPVLEAYGERTEELDDRILDGAGDGVIGEVHSLRRELLSLRHTLWPQREAVSALMRHDVPYVTEELATYLRDVADHSSQLMDMVEVYREVAQGLVDLHLSMMSNRMNEIMKVLTIIATIFIPITFIAGLYGMNFSTESPWNMPELKWKYGYLYALGLMLCSTAIMLFTFWRHGWIGGRQKTGARTPESQGHQRGRQDGAG